MRYRYLVLISILYFASGIAAFLIPEVLDTSLRQSLLMVCGVLALGAYVQYFLYRRKVYLPLQKLKTALERFEAGEPFDERGWKDIPAEIRILVDVLISLIQPHQELRRSVEERTRELEQANKNLRSAVLRLEELNKTKSDFVNMVSHELRTPLAVIKGFATTLKKYADAIPQEKVKNYYDIMDSEAERLSRLIGELLDISRIQEGRITLRTKLVDLREVAASVTNRLKIKSNTVQFSLQFPEEASQAFGDPDKITQVLVNLLGNALKYSPPESTIAIHAVDLVDTVKIQVQDQGPGIPEQWRKRLFEPFFRLDDDVNKKNPGTGLGLSISKSLVEAMGGRLYLEPAVGPGATFSFTLPKQKRASPKSWPVASPLPKL